MPDPGSTQGAEASEAAVEAAMRDMLATKRHIAVGLMNSDEMSAGMIAFDALVAAHDPALGEDRSVSFRWHRAELEAALEAVAHRQRERHRAEVTRLVEEAKRERTRQIEAWLRAWLYNGIADSLTREFGGGQHE